MKSLFVEWAEKVSEHYFPCPLFLGRPVGSARAYGGTGIHSFVRGSNVKNGSRDDPAAPPWTTRRGNALSSSYLLSKGPEATSGGWTQMDAVTK